MNYLFIAIDDLNSWVLNHTLYKGPIYTPNLDQFSNQAMDFSNAYAQTAVCNPSRTSVLTGHNPNNTGVINNTQPYQLYVHPDQTIPLIFHNANYTTASVGKVLHDVNPILHL